ncbi:hypothetical protein ACWC3X_25565 [Streptomyces populi]
MKPDQDPERTPSRETAAMKGRVTPGPAEPQEAAMKGRVTPVPAERSPDDRADENRGGTEEVSRREALKGQVEPVSTEPAPGAPDAPGTPDRNGGGRAARSAGAGTAARGAADAESPAGDSAGSGERMLPLDEHEKFSLRMRHAVGGFVDGPQASVEEADHVLEELAGRFTEAVTRRRRALRTSWQSGGEGTETGSDTERLRLALRDYREMTERLLRL